MAAIRQLNDAADITTRYNSEASVQLSRYLPVLRLFIFLTPEPFCKENFVKYEIFLGLFNKNVGNWYYCKNNFDSLLKIMAGGIHIFTLKVRISEVLGIDKSYSMVI